MLFRYHCSNHHHGGIPGVFNCRFTNPYTAAMTKRKKKKPTSFVPPPSVGENHNPIPFWCRPLPIRHSHQVHQLIDCLVSLNFVKTLSLDMILSISVPSLKQLRHQRQLRKWVKSCWSLTQLAFVRKGILCQMLSSNRHKTGVKVSRFRKITEN